MSHALRKRIQQLEEAKGQSLPVEPWPIMLPHFMAGTPEAIAEEQAFQEAHPGRDVVLIRVVDARRKQEPPCET